MKVRHKDLLCLLFAIALYGCSANPNRTHRADVLDDKVTEQRVQQALTAAGADFKSVHAQATNGVVILSGTIATPELRSRAEDIARSVRRVSRLEDNVEVQNGH